MVVPVVRMVVRAVVVVCVVVAVVLVVVVFLLVVVVLVVVVVVVLVAVVCVVVLRPGVGSADGQEGRRVCLSGGDERSRVPSLATVVSVGVPAGAVGVSAGAVGVSASRGLEQGDADAGEEEPADESEP